MADINKFFEEKSEYHNSSIHSITNKTSKHQEYKRPEFDCHKMSVDQSTKTFDVY